MAADVDIDKALKAAKAELDSQQKAHTEPSRFEGEDDVVVDTRESAILQTVVSRLEEAAGAYERLNESEED